MGDRNNVKPIEVTMVGKANCSFIVKNPKKIEWWKKIIKKNQEIATLVVLSYREINEKRRFE